MMRIVYLKSCAREHRELFRVHDSIKKVGRPALGKQLIPPA
jgi:hypothetical protein